MGAAQQEHWGSWWLTDLDSTEKSSACCLYFCHNMLKLRQHYELSWPEFSDVFLAEKVSRRNMTKTHAGTHLSPYCGRAWEEKGDFTHQHNQPLSPRLHGLSCQTKYPDLPTFSGGNVLNFQKTVLWRAETGQKAGYSICKKNSCYGSSICVGALCACVIHEPLTEKWSMYSPQLQLSALKNL